jgi:glycosyltransferase involved in cell wall biosynthesis
VKSGRKRILLVAPSLRGGGAERVMATLTRHLDRTCFEPHLALVRAEGPHLSDIPSDVPIHDLKAKRARYALSPIVRLCWKLRPDLLLATSGYLNLAVLIAKPALPRKMRLLVREVTTVSSNLAQDFTYPRVWGWLYRLLYKKADWVICASDHMRNDLAEKFGVPLHKMVRIYNPVDKDRIQALADSVTNPYTGAGPQIVTGGRLSREKGIDVLLESMELVHRVNSTARLTILGTGPLEDTLRKQTQTMGLDDVVTFMGFQSNPYPYYKYADLFVLSSYYEGLPNGVLEALALGTRVVAADIPSGMREIAERTECLKLVADRTPERLADGIIECLKEGGTRSQVEADGPLLKTFGVGSIVSEYEGLFRKVMDGIRV